MADASLDRFGIAMLHPTARGGRVWTSAWDNGFPRTLTSGQRDVTYDPAFIARGSSTTIAIDGGGIARLSGVQPRMYVYERGRTWDNVEITFYARRIRESEPNSVQGFIAGARSEHQDASDDNPCLGRAYYGRMLYSGRIHFAKELSHPHHYSYRPDGDPHADWGTADGAVPVERWVGYKFVVRNFDHGSKVRFTLYRDMSEGENGGEWEQLLHEADAGDWPVEPDPRCSYSPTEVLTQPATSVFIRNTEIEAADYSKFSIREIAPE